MNIRAQSWGRLKVTITVAVVALVAAACGDSTDTQRAAPDSTTLTATGPLPTIPLTSLEDSSTTTLGEFVGRPLVVNFWAEWCPSCVAEMSAAFKPVREDLGDRVTFIGVNIQDSREKALALLNQTDVGWVSLENQDGSLWAELGGLGMPFTVFISEDGRVVARHNGPLTEKLLRDRIEETILG